MSSEPKKQVAASQSTSTRSARTVSEIRGLMAAQRRTTAELSLIIGVSPSTASRRLKHANLTFDEVETIAGWLGVTYERLIVPAELAYSA